MEPTNALRTTAQRHDTAHEHAGDASGSSPPLMRHEYDGIREYDNPTPGWWHILFLGSVVFSVFYGFFWHFSPAAWTLEEAWASRQTAENKRIFGAIGTLEADDASILRMTRNGTMMDVARSIYAGNCAQCHAPNGGAGGGAYPGVNLTDDHFKNVRQLTDLYHVLTVGANNGAMPAWENRLSKNERIILAAYVSSLRGTNVPGGKGPEGEVIPPWPAASDDANQAGEPAASARR
jgi:cytochrome c oxidase cbb3-type subunit 3